MTEGWPSFDQLDVDHNGFIDRNEFSAGTEGVDGDIGIFGDAGGNTFLNSVIMIIVTELGDKTFFIAAIMAMKHDRWAVFVGAIGALIAMTILSAVIGFALPALLAREYTHYAAAVLFLYFGAKLLWDAREMSGGVSDELQEAEEEIAEVEEKMHLLDGEGDAAGGGGNSSPADLEAGRANGDHSSPTDGDARPSSATGEEDDGYDPDKTKHGKREKRVKKVAAVHGHGFNAWLVATWSVISQVFIMTFLGEWGDRSQVATVALAAAKDPVAVAVGGFVGHALCTGLAVAGGRLLATKISERTVAILGGALFIVFGIHAFWVGPEEI